MIISVITICLNDLQGLKKTRDSVIEQSSNNYEHIIVDGGSRDGTRDYLEELHEKNTIWVSETDRGRSDAFNKGISLAHGDLLLCLNAGDTFYNEDVIADVTQEWSKEPVDILSYSVEYADGHIMRCVNEEWWSKGLLAHQGLFVSKRVYEQAGGYNLFLQNRMDYDFFLRITQLPFTHRLINRIAAKFDLNGTSSYNPQNAKLEGIGLRLIYNKTLSEQDLDDLSELVHGKEQPKSIKNDDKNKKYALMYNWMLKESVGKQLKSYLMEKGFHRVSIYGAGQLGALVKGSLSDSPIKIVDIVDRQTERYLGDQKAISLEEMSCETDTVIVTVIDDYDEIEKSIEEHLKKTCDIQERIAILSLKKIVAEM